MINYEYIQPYKEVEWEFKGCYCFSKDGINLLLTKDATNIIITDELLKLIKNKEIKDDLLFKLIQRGFIKYKKSRSVVENNTCVEPTFFLVDLTSRCNLNCIYCFRELEKSNRDKMSTKTALDICRYIEKYCIENKIKDICIQPWGGEPLIEFPTIKKIQDFFKNTDINVKMTIETNATLISYDIAQELFDRKFSIGISLDGTKELHDTHRKRNSGLGSYDDVIKGIENLNKVGFKHKLGAICVITKKNYRYVSNIIEHFVEELGINNIKFNLVKTNDVNLVLNKKEIAKFANDLFEKTMILYRKGFNIVSSDIKDRLDNILYRANNSICISSGCMSGRKMISFNRAGDIFPCEMTDFSNEKLGNIKEKKNLKKVVRDSLKTSHLYKEDKIAECNSCPWWYFCRGGCRANKNYGYEFSKIVDEHECVFNKVLYGKIVEWIIENIYKGGNI